MTEQMAVEICKDAVWTTLLVAAPMLIAGLVVGIAVSLFQSVTQIHEMTLTFIPKISRWSCPDPGTALDYQGIAILHRRSLHPHRSVK